MFEITTIINLRYLECMVVAIKCFMVNFLCQPINNALLQGFKNLVNDITNSNFEL